MTVAMDKPGGFVGREALAAAGPPRRRLVSILLADPEPQLYHGETVLHDGRVVGRVTSGAYGHTLGAAVGLAALEGDPARADDVLAPATWTSRSPAVSGLPASLPAPSTTPTADACAAADHHPAKSQPTPSRGA